MKKFICVTDNGAIKVGDIAVQDSSGNYVCNQMNLTTLFVEHNSKIWQPFQNDAIHQDTYNSMVSKIHLLDREYAEKLKADIDLFFPISQK